MARHVHKGSGFAAVLFFIVLCAGCSNNGVTLGATSTPIFVTATPPQLPPTPQIEPVITAVISTAVPGAETTLSLVDLMPTAVAGVPTNTATPLPTTAPTLTPSFTVTLTETITPTGARVVFAGNTFGGAGFAGTGGCTSPSGSFAAIYGADPALASALGCALSAAVPINGALQEFENGRMVWTSQLADVPGEFIFAAFNNGTYGRYADTWTDGQDVGYDNVPAGRLGPMRGFGKVWRENQGVRDGLGWALYGENGSTAQIQRFERGEMVFLVGTNQTYVFIANQSWRVF